MAGILDLASARAALGWADGTNQTQNADLQDLYIPAVEHTIAGLCGSIEDRTEAWTGRAQSSIITLPWVEAQIFEVRLNRTPTVDWIFTAPQLTITDETLTPGDRVTVVAGGLPIPADVRLAARAILKQLWNAERQGAGQQGARTEKVGQVPIGVAIPARAATLLAPYLLPGEIA